MTAEAGELHSSRRVSLFSLGVSIFYFGLVTLILLIGWELPWSISALVPQQQRAMLIALVSHGVIFGVVAAAWCGVYRSRSVRPAVPRVLVALWAPTILLSLDLVASIAFPPWEHKKARFCSHPIRGWTNAPGSLTDVAGATVLMDSLGMRIDDVTRQPARSDEPSVLIVGDSVALGWGVAYRDSFGVRAVESLKSRHRGLVLQPRLGATGGYDATQEANWLEEVGLGIKPVVVVMQMCLNDVFLSYNPNQFWANRFSNDLVYPGPPLSWSAIGRGFYSLKNISQEGTGLFKEYAPVDWFGVPEMLAEKESPRVLASWARTLKAYDRVENLCRSANVPLVVMVFPLADQLVEPKAARHGQRRMSEWAKSHGAVFIDVMPDYLSREANGHVARGRYFIDMAHPTVEGHRIAGELLSSALESIPAIRALIGR